MTNSQCYSVLEILKNLCKQFEDLKNSVNNNLELEKIITIINEKINEINASLEAKSPIDHTHNEYSLDTHTHPQQANCDTVDNLHFICLTRTEFDTLPTKDSSTVYLVKEG